MIGIVLSMALPTHATLIGDEITIQINEDEPFMLTIEEGDLSSQAGLEGLGFLSDTFFFVLAGLVPTEPVSITFSSLDWGTDAGSISNVFLNDDLESTQFIQEICAGNAECIEERSLFVTGLQLLSEIDITFDDTSFTLTAPSFTMATNEMLNPLLFAAFLAVTVETTADEMQPPVVSEVPTPSPLWLLLVGLVTLALRRRGIRPPHRDR